MNLNKTQFDLLQDFADDHDVQLRLAYSGRGKMGKECIGFVTNESEFALGMNLGQYLTNEDENLFDHLQKNIKTDSMGMDTIIYFPNVQMPDDQYTIHNDFDESEDIIEQQRRDEKHGLYPALIDPSN